MRVEDYDSAYDVFSDSEVELALSKRHAGHNEFWLSHGSNRHPVISILVSGDAASALYIPRKGHPGFASIETVPHAEPDKTHVFYVTPTEKIWVKNDQVISFADALRIAHEFATSEEMPKCIRWSSLVEGE
jgi:hypothetical protein